MPDAGRRKTQLTRAETETTQAEISSESWKSGEDKCLHAKFDKSELEE